ncbi:hypothetical protein [Kingella oralis]|jgi:hypothetical protein|uniref:hypothetical protein n=1 Tax=Kingella oralis TaxID=505 RepID=UPI003C6F8430
MIDNLIYRCLNSSNACLKRQPETAIAFSGCLTVCHFVYKERLIDGEKTSLYQTARGQGVGIDVVW